MRTASWRNGFIFVLFLASIAVESHAETRFASINVDVLDQYANALLLRTERGRQLVAQQAEMQAKDAAYRKENASASSPFLSMSVALNDALDGERRLLLNKYIVRVAARKFALVIGGDSQILYQADRSEVADITHEVVEAIEADFGAIE
jgi:hypothetical protein